ncbi:peptidase C65 Otubain-domain-containing protein [Tribonema minus]|uniref:ubiquitinyl hydrolase 1 n=1 Tax=Tribonema minus TaxID=303371 RepID=A0A836CLC9_9STRA|nr:peptidase C65 Otubain-domain-containing protein [Tribonema minus]
MSYTKLSDGSVIVRGDRVHCPKRGSGVVSLIQSRGSAASDTIHITLDSAIAATEKAYVCNGANLGGLVRAPKLSQIAARQQGAMFVCAVCDCIVAAGDAVSCKRESGDAHVFCSKHLDHAAPEVVVTPYATFTQSAARQCPLCGAPVPEVAASKLATINELGGSGANPAEEEEDEMTTDDDMDFMAVTLRMGEGEGAVTAEVTVSCVAEWEDFKRTCGAALGLGEDARIELHKPVDFKRTCGAALGLGEDARTELHKVKSEVVWLADISHGDVLEVVHVRDGGAAAQRAGPNLGPTQPLAELLREAGLEGKAAETLSSSYAAARRVRGDGNCYYRALAFAALEAFLAERRWTELSALRARLAALTFYRAEHGDAHARLMATLQSVQECSGGAAGSDSAAAQALEDALCDKEGGVDTPLIRACRAVVAGHLEALPEAPTPGGLTYREIIEAQEGHTIEQYCKDVVLAMGADARDFWIELGVLPRLLGVRCTIMCVVEDGAPGAAHVHARECPDAAPNGSSSGGGSGSGGGGGAAAQVHVHLLLRRGHYDLLYPLPAAAAAAAQGHEASCAAASAPAAAAPSAAAAAAPRAASATAPVPAAEPAAAAAATPAPSSLVASLRQRFERQSSLSSASSSSGASAGGAAAAVAIAAAAAAAAASAASEAAAAPVAVTEPEPSGYFTSAGPAAVTVKAAKAERSSGGYFAATDPKPAASKAKFAASKTVVVQPQPQPAAHRAASAVSYFAPAEPAAARAAATAATAKAEPAAYFAPASGDGDLINQDPTGRGSGSSSRGSGGSGSGVGASITSLVDGGSTAAAAAPAYFGYFDPMLPEKRQNGRQPRSRSRSDHKGGGGSGVGDASAAAAGYFRSLSASSTDFKSGSSTSPAARPLGDYFVAPASRSSKGGWAANR